MAICWSPLLPGLLSVDSSLAFVTAFALFTALVFAKRGVDIPQSALALLLMACCLLLFLATGSRTLLARTVPVPLLIFAASQAASIQKLPEAICNALTAYLTVGVVLSIVGFVYAFGGGEALLSIANPDGRENALYLTTMTNFWVGNVIRPSYIYDEPGAFSFLLCATVALRELLGKRFWPSLFLMLGGLITLSLTHLLIALLFLTTRLGFVKTCVLTAAVLVGGYMASEDIDMFDFFTARFVVEDGKLTGDNRSNQMGNLIDIINPKIFLFGDVVCHDRPDRSCPEHGDISSSPATPVYRGGLFLLSVQLVVHVSLIMAFVRRKRFRFAALTFTVLLLQRPFFDGVGYGFITFTAVFLMFRSAPHLRRCPTVPFSDVTNRDLSRQRHSHSESQPVPRNQSTPRFQ